jgi:hypothetical protein
LVAEPTRDSTRLVLVVIPDQSPGPLTLSRR